MNMIANNSATKLSLIMLSFTAFFYYITARFAFNGYYLLLVAILPILLRFAVCLKSNTKSSGNLAWYLFLLISVMSLAISKAQGATVRFIFLVGTVVVIKTVFENIRNWQKFICKLFFIMTFIHVISTLLFLFIPDQMLVLARVLLGEGYFSTYLNLYNLGSYPGITGQTSSNAFYASVFIALSFCQLLNGKHRSRNLLFLFLGICVLFMTAKRSFLLNNIIAVCYIILKDKKGDQKSWIKKICMILVMISLGYLILLYIPQANAILEKIAIFNDSTDVSNGRFRIWQNSLLVFKQNPIFGIGGGALVTAYGISSHNVFIQILAEMGIIGALVFIIAMLRNLLFTSKTMDEMMQKEVYQVDDKVCYQSAMYIQIVFIIYCFFGNPFYGIDFIVIYMLMVAVINSYWYQYQESFCMKKGESC